VIELVPLQAGGGALWIVLGIIMAFWVYKIETGGSSSDDPRGRNPAPEKTGSSSTEKHGKQQPDPASEPEPDSEPESIGDDLGTGIDRDQYKKRREHPEFDPEGESRKPTDGSPALEEVPDMDELPDPDDLYEDQ
jgi:hypothetical protein